MRAAAFFDRDGILNETFVHNGKPFAPRELKDFKIIPAAIEMVSRFKKAGYVIVVVTNQPDVGNGLVAKEMVEQMNNKLLGAMPIDLIKVCFHSQKENCSCRKPKPGMLLAAAVELNLDLSKSIMVGDRGSDIEAGYRAGCFTIFLKRGYNEQMLISPNFVSNSIDEILPSGAAP